VNITVNRNTVPFDERPPTVASGVRMGTPACTMRGFDDEDFREVGRIVCGALSLGLEASPAKPASPGRETDAPAARRGADINGLVARAGTLCERRPLYPGFRGYTAYEA
jgi:glycine hydroxymethyltransferase